jgi:hypothetical protein
MSAVDVSYGSVDDPRGILHGEHDVGCGKAADRHTALGGRRAALGALVAVERIGRSCSFSDLALIHVEALHSSFI